VHSEQDAHAQDASTARQQAPVTASTAGSSRSRRALPQASQLLRCDLTDGPFNGIALWFYKKLKDSFPSMDETAGGKFNLSMAGYAAAAFVTTPADVVKTRIQVQASNPEIFNYKGPIDCARQILAKEGLGAFFSGWAGRVGWLTPRCAMAITSFEVISGYLKG
jgi:solute carrier family 25 aspartate/glutamate transporter 12/13